MSSRDHSLDAEAGNHAAQPRTRQPQTAAAAGQPSAPAEFLLHLQRTAGNRAVSHWLHDQQRQTRVAQTGSRTPATAPPWLQRTNGTGTGAAPAQATQEEETGQQAIATWKAKGEFVYRKDKPLDPVEGHALLARLARGDWSALDGLEWEEPAMYKRPASPREHEWGLLQSKYTREVFIIPGYSGEVDATPYLAHVIQLAHSHPFYRDRNKDKTRDIGVDNPERKGYIPLEVLTAADHMDRTLSKLLPSPGDVKFCANNQLQQHTVYTPFAYAEHPQKAIINPDFHPSVDQTLPRIRFEIHAARQDPQNQNVYHCTLVAKVGGNETLWENATVTVDMTNQVSPATPGTMKWAP